MIILQGQSLIGGEQFTPDSMGLNLSERQSTATVNVGPDAPGIAVNQWMQDNREPGKGIVWRVKAVDETYNTRSRVVTLEHLINSLRDISMFGEVKPKDMAGSASATTCTAKQAAQYVLSKQSIWTLGDFEYSTSAPFSFNGDDLFSAMEKISSALDDPWWDYDFSSMPFKLHIRKQTSAKQCEMRMGRNISTLRKTVDRTNMYTRIYPIGKKNLHIDGDYISRNEEIWGRKDKVETDQSQETKEALQLWALDRLKRHCEPIVTITVGGLELSEATGEPLDHLILGTICQVPLPEFGTTITERITKLSWKDKIKEAENVTATLCNARQDLATIISQQASGGGGGARAAAKEAEEDHAWFVDTTDHVAMVAEAIVGREGQTVDWSRVAEIIVDGEGIHQKVVQAEEDIVTAFTDIEINESAISAEITNRQNADTTLQGLISVTSESLSALYTKTGVNSLGASETLYSLYQQNAQQIALKVSAGDVATQLAVECGNVTISGGDLVVDGYVTTQGLAAVDARIDALIAGTTQVEGLYSRNNITALGWITAGAYVNSSDVQVNGTSVKGAIAGIGTATASGGQITIPTTKLDGSAGPDINFNIADTAYYQNAVSAAESDGWAAARAKVEPPAQGTGDSFTVKVPSATEGQQQTYTFTMQKGATPGSTGYASVALSGVGVGRIEIGSWYDAGVTAGKNAVTINKGSWSGGVVSFTKSEGTASTKTVQLSKGAETWDGNSCSFPILDGSGSTGYTCTVDASARYTAGQNSVSVSSFEWTGNSEYSYNTIRANASNGNSSTLTLYMSQGSWSSGSKTVYVRTGSTSGTIRARVSVSMPSAADASWSWSYPAQGYIMASITVGGKTYSASHSI